MIKTSSLKTRSLEALIGAATGGAGGYGAGHTTYKPDTPRYVVDQRGYATKRQLSSGEKKTRTSRAKKGAIAGAVAGIGGSTGFSMLRRARQAVRDVESSPALAQAYLGPLKEYVERLKTSPIPDAEPIGQAVNRSQFLRKRRIAEAEKLVDEFEGKIKDAPERAGKARDKSLYGGAFWLKGSKKTKAPRMPSKRTAEGQIIRDIFGAPEGLDEALRSPEHLGGFYKRLVAGKVDPRGKI